VKKDEKFESLLKEYQEVLEKLIKMQLQRDSLLGEYLDSSKAIYNFVGSEIPKEDRKSAEAEMMRVEGEVYEKVLSKRPQEEL
jgi:hypothetical protein